MCPERPYKNLHCNMQGDLQQHKKEMENNKGRKLTARERLEVCSSYLILLCLPVVYGKIRRSIQIILLSN